MFDGLQRLLSVTSLNPDKDVFCGICKQIIVDASQIICGCRFCRRCIVRFITEGGRRCPVDYSEDCRQVILSSVDDIHSENETNRVIMRLTVKCPIVGCEVEGEIEEMIDHVDECRNINGNDIQELNKEGNEKNTLRNVVNSLEKSVELQFEGFKELMKELNNRMTNIENRIGMNTTQIEELVSKISKINKFYFIWKITQFSQKKKNNTFIYSDCFYTKKYGYNLKLLFYPNGDDCKGAYLSLYFKILKGEYDDILCWPFKYDVTLSILDQEGLSRDFTSTVKCQSTTDYVNIYERPSEFDNRSYGKSQFFALSSFERQPYLKKNDTIYLQFSFTDTEL